MAKYNLDNIMEKVSKREEPLNYYPDDTRVDISGSGSNEDKSVVYLDIRTLIDNPNNHFSKMDGETWEEFVGSIKELGILTPLIVRDREDGNYEILAGHNRKNAAMEIGLDKLPCLIVDADDVEASVIVAVTNKQRENTTDIEWAWCYRTTYEALKRTAGRHSIENCDHSGHNLRTVDIVAEKYGIGRNTLQRKMRLAYLIPQLAGLYLDKKITQAQAVDLSYLNMVQQANVVMGVSEYNYKMTNEIAKELRARAEASEDAGEDFNIDEIFDLLKNESEPVIKTKRVKKYEVDESLFPINLKKGVREAYITKALEYIRDNEIEIEI